MPDLLREQFPHFRPIVEAFGYRNLEFEGWEADDVIATLATRADEADDPHLRRLDRPRRVPALQREHLPDDDPARRRGRPRLHAGAGRAPLRHPPRPGAGLHRSQGRHVGQHPGHPRHRRQDGRAADRAVRLARGGDRARRRAVAGARQGRPRARRAGARLEAPRDDAARPAARRRRERARRRAARPVDAEGDLPPLRVPRPSEPRRHAGRGAPVRRDRARAGDDPVARGCARGACVESTQAAARRRRRRRPGGRGDGSGGRRRRGSSGASSGASSTRRRSLRTTRSCSGSGRRLRTTR